MEKTKIDDFDSLAMSEEFGIFGDILADFANHIAKEAADEDSDGD